MVDRLVNAADFKRLLATPMRSRSAHFAVHHVAGRPWSPARAAIQALITELSTATEPSSTPSVDDLPTGWWAGALIPKRHAKRSVTRSLLKRQVRAALDRHQERLEPGLWLVRLRQPFPREHYPSAASEALRTAARGELDLLLTRAARKPT